MVRPIRSTRWLASLALVVIAAASTSDAVVHSPASVGTIAFISDRANSFDIYVVGADGGGLRRLTASPTDEFSPAWSPDGARIAFATDSGYLQLQRTGAFASLDEENMDIYAIGADGTGAQRLTAQTGDVDRHFCDDQLDPAWSPDGTKIAFSSNHAGNFEIYVMNANGSGWQRLTRSRAGDQAPAWSPDGRQIAYASSLPGGQPRWSAGGGHSEIYVMNADGSGRRRLARNPAGNETSFGCANPPSIPRPAWSPDGKKIAFERFRGYSSPRIYVINTDGSGRRRLTTKDDTGPSWSPDGRGIAFSRYTRRGSDIYLMSPDGSGPRRLTKSRAEDLLPAWRPGPGPAR